MPVGTSGNIDFMYNMSQKSSVNDILVSECISKAATNQKDMLWKKKKSIKNHSADY